MTLFKTTILSTAAAALLLSTSAMATPVGSMDNHRAASQVQEPSSVTNVIKVKKDNARRNHGSERRNWRGHRGYRDQRRGYRRHSDGWWYPLAAFGAGVVGSAIVNGIQHGNSHVTWCHDTYRSYREWDNTFQPFNGSRRQCNSPYG